MHLCQKQDSEFLLTFRLLLMLWKVALEMPVLPEELGMVTGAAARATQRESSEGAQDLVSQVWS